MAHGTPDYGVTAGRVTTHRLTDLGELAARLGSPVTFDRRGDVVWWDDFECGLAQIVGSGSGTGNAHALYTTEVRSGAQAVLLTAGSTDDHLFNLRKHLPPQVESAFGGEFSWRPLSVIESMAARLDFWIPPNEYRAELRWTDATQLLEYADSAGAYQTFAAGVDFAQDNSMFHTFKIVADMATRRYVRAIADDREYDLSGIDMHVFGAASTTLVRLNARLVGRAANNDTVAIDDMIVTQNEPL
jgi:hypothetical protein